MDQWNLHNSQHICQQTRYHVNCNNGMWHIASRISLREGMAVPPEQLPVRLLTEFSVEIAMPLTHIYNRSLQEGYVPMIWRRATITPVPKKSAPESPGDLRPISLTPTFSKVLEQFIVPLIMEDIRPAMDIYRYGNIQGASTTHYLIRLIHSIAAPHPFVRAFHTGCYSSCVYCASDGVWENKQNFCSNATLIR